MINSKNDPVDQVEQVSKKIIAKPQKVVNGFRYFLATGNITSFAVGMVVGTAMQNMIQSFLKDLFLPLIDNILGSSYQLEAQKLILNHGHLVLSWGDFVIQVISFLFTAFAVYLVIVALNKLIIKNQKQPPEIKVQEEILKTLNTISSDLKAQKKESSDK